jgi:hypothetical protein
LQIGNVCFFAAKEPKNKVGKCANFPTLKKWPFALHVCHAFHHNFTTFLPSTAPGNRQKAPQNNKLTTPN